MWTEWGAFHEKGTLRLLNSRIEKLVEECSMTSEGYIVDQNFKIQWLILMFTDQDPKKTSYEECPITSGTWKALYHEQNRKLTFKIEEGVYSDEVSKK